MFWTLNPHGSGLQPSFESGWLFKYLGMEISSNPAGGSISRADYSWGSRQGAGSLMALFELRASRAVNQ